MAASPPEPLLLAHVRKFFTVNSLASKSDQELVQRFALARDEQAFEALVHRHGPMVFRVCQRVLGRVHEAEDAFQATFLVLARKAHSLRDQASVGSWLYGVASRVALKARAVLRSATPVAGPGHKPAPAPLEELTLREARATLDEEVARLPDKLRGPLVLCCLEGRTRDEAALELRLPLSTLKSRLEQARDQLRRRLVRRGIALSAALAVALMTAEAGASIPVALVRKTVRGAILFRAGTLGADAPVTAGALALAKGAMYVMPIRKLAALAAAVLFAISFAGLGAAIHRTPEAEPAAPPVAAAVAGERLTALARRLWDITELVATKHPQPPGRVAMLEAAAQALYKEAKASPPADLRGRVNDVTGPGQLATFLKSAWPADADATQATADRLEAAVLKGLLGSVPGTANLLSANEVRITGQISANRYVGIGIQIAMDEKARRAVIIDPFRRGTAQKAGVKPNDLILRVNGKDTHGVSLGKVVEWLRGEEGTKVTIEVRQPDSDTSRTYSITRAPVPFDTVFGYRRGGDEWQYRIDPGHAVGYVRVSSLTSSTLHELRQAERRLRDEGARSVVLDLRSSDGGGELHLAELVAGSLVERKVLWRTRDAGGRVKEAKSGSEVLFRDWPMAVLVDGRIPGPAAQMVAAALQDAGRAVVVGEKTEMDGYFNSLFPLPESGYSLVIRTGRLERVAKDRGWPVQPDHVVPLDKAAAAAVDAWLMAKGRSQAPAAADRAPADPQLAKAVDLLRAATDKAGQEK